VRSIHLIIGLLGVIAFVLSGQFMKHHHPRMVELPAEVRMMYVSRHIYLLGASLVNVAFGLCLQSRPEGWACFAACGFLADPAFAGCSGDGVSFRARAGAGRTQLAKLFRHDWSVRGSDGAPRRERRRRGRDSSPRKILADDQNAGSVIRHVAASETSTYSRRALRCALPAENLHPAQGLQKRLGRLGRRIDRHRYRP
jgi:hypothetical protein